MRLCRVRLLSARKRQQQVAAVVSVQTSSHPDAALSDDWNALRHDD